MSMTTTTGEEDASAQDQRNIKDQAKEKVQMVVSKSQEKLGDVVHMATDQAKGRITEKKDQAADSLEQVASAIREAGHQLQSKEQATLGSAAEEAARTVDNVSDYLKRSDVDEFVRQSESFARRQPVGFLAGALTLGYIAGRFLAASSNKGPDQGNGGGQGTASIGTRALPQTGTNEAAPNLSATVTSDRGDSEIRGPYADNAPADENRGSNL